MKKGKYKSWTTREERVITELREYGWTYGRIAVKLGRSRSSVVSHVCEIRKRDKKRLAAESDKPR